MNKEQREQLASDLLAEAAHRRGRVVDLLRNAAAALSTSLHEQEHKEQQKEVDFAAIIRHGEEVIRATMEFSPAPSAPQVQGERERNRAVQAAFDDWSWNKKGEAVGRMDGQTAAMAGFHAGAEWQLRAALSTPPAAWVPAVSARPQTCNGKRCGWCKEGAEPCHYTPPASEQQPAIVLPERRTEYVGDRDNLQWARGANFMLGEFLRLNPHLQPAAPAQEGDA